MATGRHPMGVVVASVMLAGMALVGVPATEAAPEGVVTEAFSYTGSLQSFDVSTGICGLTIEATGGSGGGDGGFGATVSAHVVVEPLETLSVLVGGAGTDEIVGSTYVGGDGGFGGGGGGGATIGQAGSGGGGASSVGRTFIGPGGPQLVVAGGGGGGHGALQGGDAGLIGADGDSGEGMSGSGVFASGGGGGTAAGAGGAGGAFDSGAGAIDSGAGGGVHLIEPPLPGGMGDGSYGGGGATTGDILGANAGAGQTGAGGLGSPFMPEFGIGDGDGGTGTTGGGVGASAGTETSGGGGGGGGLGFGGGGGSFVGGGGGGGYGGGGAGGGAGGGGSSTVRYDATATASQLAASLGNGAVTISYDAVEDACPVPFHYVVHGTVTNSDGDPIEGVWVGARIPIFHEPWVELGSTVTAADGTYEIAFDSLYSLPYLLDFSPPEPYEFLRTEMFFDAPVDHQVDQVLSRGPPPGVLEGTIRGAGGVPLEGIPVYLTTYCTPGVGCGGPSAVSDADGHYRMEGIDPGSYGPLSFVLSFLDPGTEGIDYLREDHRDMPLLGGSHDGDTVVIPAGETTTVDALLQPVCPDPKPFPDLTVFCGEIDWLVDDGIIAGFADGTFKPDRSLTRQAFVAFLWRLAGEPPVPAGAPNFSDVGPSHPFRSAIRWAAADGIVNGFPDGTFKPTRTITRQAFAAFLYRIVGEPPGPFPAPDPVVLASNPFYLELSWLTEVRYEGRAWQGLELVAFDPAPTSPVLRRTVAAALYRAQGEGYFDT